MLITELLCISMLNACFLQGLFYDPDHRTNMHFHVKCLFLRGLFCDADYRINMHLHVKCLFLQRLFYDADHRIRASQC
jgi:hypothetical protein